MVFYPYSFQAAFDPNTGTAAPRDSVGQVYPVGDTSFANPLPTFDLNGMPVTLTVGEHGYLPDFQVEDHTAVVWRSGEYVFQFATTIPVKGDTGDTGKSAYEAAVEEGFEGTEPEWLESLKGSNVVPTDEAIAGNLTDPGSITSAALDESVSEKMGAAESLTGALLRGMFARKEFLPVNVKDYGAKGDGTTADHEAIQAALAGGKKHVYFPAGRYLLQSHLRVQSDTRIEMHPDCVLLNDNLVSEYVFINGIVGNDNYAPGGYSGDGNIWISGGQINNGLRAAKKWGTQAVCIGHAENVLIENVHFRNNYISHFMELNATKNAVVRNCTFTNLDSHTYTDREAINIDYSFKAGFPPFGTYDATPCLDILIEDCVFTNCQDGVGSHSAATAGHKDINIRGCKFYNLTARPVRSNGWLSGSMTDCYVDGAGEQAVLLNLTRDFNVTNNRFYNCGTKAHNTYGVVHLIDGSDCYVGQNRVSSTVPNKYKFAYTVSSGIRHRVDTKGADPGADPFVLWNAGTLSVIDGTITCFINDDSSVALPVPGSGGQGLVMISMRSSAAYAPRGLYWWRADGSAVNLQAIAQITPTGLVLTTGALTGTTGTDGNITMSTHTDRKLYIENRAGTQRVVDIQFMAG